MYFVNQEMEKKHKNEKKLNETDIPHQVETVIDALVGNLKDYVAVDTKADGSKEIAVQLTTLRSLLLSMH